MARVDNKAEDAVDELALIAMMHLEIVFPQRKFGVDAHVNVSGYCIDVVASFVNAHGRQFVVQQCGGDCLVKDFRWSDASLTKMMLLE